MVEYWANWVRQYPAICSIEDGMSEEDWDGWKLMTDTLGKKIQFVGDDIFVTNPSIFKRGIEKGIANSILVKVNQIGTLSETLEAMSMARARQLHRGGFAPLGRDGRSLHRRPCSGDRRGPDQDRLGQPHRPHRQVQPVAAHRRAARQRRAVPRQEGVPPVTKLVLVRHGESTWNKENRFTGWTDVDLSEKGRQEALEGGARPEGGRLHLRRGIHLGAEARHPHAVDGAR